MKKSEAKIEIKPIAKPGVDVSRINEIIDSLDDNKLSPSELRTKLIKVIKNYVSYITSNPNCFDLDIDAVRGDARILIDDVSEMDHPTYGDWTTALEEAGDLHYSWALILKCTLVAFYRDKLVAEVRNIIGLLG